MIYLPIQTKELNISSPFGPRGKQFHNGIDLAYPKGTKIYALENGKMIRKVDQYGGNWQRLYVSDGFWDYVHMDKSTASRTVKQGEYISTVGNTGWSTGNHLHLDFFSYEKDQFINPITKIKKCNVEYNKYYKKEKMLEKIAKRLRGIANQLNYLSLDKITQTTRAKLPNGEVLEFTKGQKWEGVVYRNIDSNNPRWRKIFNGRTRGNIQALTTNTHLIVSVLGVETGDMYETKTKDGKTWAKWQKLF